MVLFGKTGAISYTVLIWGSWPAASRPAATRSVAQAAAAGRAIAA
jgi:hypothetical protein